MQYIRIYLYNVCSVVYGHEAERGGAPFFNCYIVSWNKKQQRRTTIYGLVSSGLFCNLYLSPFVSLYKKKPRVKTEKGSCLEIGSQVPIFHAPPTGAISQNRKTFHDRVTSWDQF